MTHRGRLVMILGFVAAAAWGSAATDNATGPAVDKEVGQIVAQIQRLHPHWDLQGLKAVKVRDMSFEANGPVYHVVEVWTANQDSDNAMGAIAVWLGLFRDGAFVRLANDAETKVWSQRTVVHFHPDGSRS